MSTQDERALRILHLSDTHLFGDGTLHYGLIDTTAALQRVLERASVLDRVDLVVLSGDLSDDGSDASYRLLRELVDPWAAARGADVVYVMGNHDGTDGFEREVGHRDGISTERGFRIIHLDSSVPGKGYGEIDEDQLAWLKKQLTSRALYGTVLVMHHPPVPATTSLLAALELQNPGALADVIEGSDVRLILAGHYHHSLVTVLGRVLVSVAPAVTNAADPFSPTGSERATIGSAFSLIDLPLDGPPRVTTVAAPSEMDGTEVFSFGPHEVEKIVLDYGPGA